MPTGFPAAPAWARDLCSVGVTGTNGKTSTSWMLAAASADDGGMLPVLTTLGFTVDGVTVPLAEHAVFVERMKRAYDAGARAAVLEMTSLSLANGAAAAWPFLGAVFTNFTRDHLDIHATAEHYLASKAQLFVHLEAGAFAVLNADDPASSLLEEVIPKGVRVHRYGHGEGADARIVDVSVSWEGTTVRLGDGTVLSIPLVGRHFGVNAVAAWIAAQSMGTEPSRAAARLASAPPLSGRFERVWPGPHVVVDYAHSPDAMGKTVATARHLARGGGVTVVFGAAGGTDPGHRPAFARAAGSADRVVITTDNPRDEDPTVIASHLRAALEGREVEVVLDRREAIEAALREAKEDDVVVLAGKGHETVQIIGRERRPWCDREAALDVLGRARRPR
jgi:UDP-N-acetylmuramoyl-L-alanyl-D-glutamate--2,6-diaminopimelate ligase